MLAHLSSVQVDYVVVLNTSRLWRSDIVKVLIQRELKKYGCDIKSIEQPFYSIHKKDTNDFLVNDLMELSVLYVAVTRAKNAVCFSSEGVTDATRNPSLWSWKDEVIPTFRSMPKELRWVLR